MRKTARDVSMIVAVDETGGFAKGRTIPWSHETDWKHFKKQTKGNVCIMGRGTYEDIAERRRKRTPNFRTLLPGRESYVISRTLTESQGATVQPSPHNILFNLVDDPREVFILGGRRLYVEFLSEAKQVWVTLVPGDYGTNKKFPMYELNKLYTIVDGFEEDGLKFVRYVRRVEYITAQLDPRNANAFEQHVKLTNRFSKRDGNSITFVNPRVNEIETLEQIGTIIKRQGLAIEDETTRSTGRER